MPGAELILWRYLRERKLKVKFRRQYSVGPYVIDFYAPKRRLAIELDGSSHSADEAKEYDRERQRYIEACGITFLRFTNQQVQKNLKIVLRRIQAAIARRSLPFK